jgi:hypothetical protein
MDIREMITRRLIVVGPEAVVNLAETPTYASLPCHSLPVDRIPAVHSPERVALIPIRERVSSAARSFPTYNACGA